MNTRICWSSILILVSTLALEAQELPGPRGPREAVPESVEALIERALVSNPEVQLAQARLRQAEAELSQARLAVARDVVLLYSEREQRQVELRHARHSIDRMKILADKGNVSDAELHAAIADLARVETAVHGVESQLRYALGMGESASTASTMPREEAKSVKQGQAQIYLTKRISIPEAEFSIIDVLESATKAIDGLNLIIDPTAREILVHSQRKYPLAFAQPLALQALLSLLHDLDPRIAFVVADYGILMTTAEKARRSNWVTVPDFEVRRDAR
ncbi:MAG: hypothetical protein KDB53_10960 [Planctomycetes bacterium]|nr:hypothetical protein [Planctomycetota bacterium]